MTLPELLLRIGYRHVVQADNAEGALEKIRVLAAPLANFPIDAAAFHDAVAACLRDGMIADPIRIADGALQCHWRLELTPDGVAAARRSAGD